MKEEGNTYSLGTVAQYLACCCQEEDERPLGTESWWLGGLEEAKVSPNQQDRNSARNSNWCCCSWCYTSLKHCLT